MEKKLGFHHATIGYNLSENDSPLYDIVYDTITLTIQKGQTVVFYSYTDYTMVHSKYNVIHAIAKLKPQYIFSDGSNQIECKKTNETDNIIEQMNDTILSRIVFLVEDLDDIKKGDVPVIVFSQRDNPMAYFNGTIYISMPKLLENTETDDVDVPITSELVVKLEKIVFDLTREDKNDMSYIMTDNPIIVILPMCYD